MVTPKIPANLRHCPSYPGYAVAKNGSVWTSLRRGIWQRRKTSIVETPRGRYEQITLRLNKRYKTVFVHRLILETFRGPCPKGHESRHLNGNSIDNRSSNLQWGTRQQNSDDKRKHGTMQAGEKNGQAKLTANQVSEIRKLRSSTTIDDLAMRFKMSRSQIKRIVYGISWK